MNGANRNYQYDDSGRRTREAWNGGANVLQWFWGARGTMTGQRYTEPGTVTDTARSTRGDGTLASLTTTVNSVTTDTISIVWDPAMAVPQPVWTGDPGTANATRAVYGPDLIRFTCPTGTSCTGPTGHDVHGSALSTTATSAVTQDSAYSPWGDGGGIFTTGANYGYRSELHTGATVHLRARDYDPETGLFLSPDPLDGVDGTTTVANAYHYTNNDPVNSTDPTGLRPDDMDLGDEIGTIISTAREAIREVLTAPTIAGFCGDVDVLPIPGLALVGGVCAIDDGTRLSALEYLGAGAGAPRGYALTGSWLFSNGRTNADLRGPALCIGGSYVHPIWAEFGLGGSGQVCLSLDRMPVLETLDDDDFRLLELTGVATVSGGGSVGLAGPTVAVTLTQTGVQEIYRYEGDWQVNWFCPGDRLISLTGKACGF